MAKPPFHELDWEGFKASQEPAPGLCRKAYASQTSQNGVRAILRVQGRALPPAAQVI
jgi:hypothetical protein